MMKSIPIAIVFNILLITNNVYAGYDQLENWVINAGKKLETIDNIPVAGKLTNILPFAIAATCLQKCPGQTMIVLASLCLYTIARHKLIYSPLRTLVTRNYKKEKEEVMQFDETLFDFEDDNQNNDKNEIDNDLMDEQISQKTLF